MTHEVSTSSASYAVEVARLLWPEPWTEPAVVRSRHRDVATHRDAYVFPSERRPRMLVPADLPESAVMLQRLNGSGSVLVGSARRVLERSVRSPAFPLLRWPLLRVQGADPHTDSIERHLAQHLGVEVRIGVLLGTRRVNQKPVLQIFDRSGSVLGYAKVGHNPLTTELVRREAEALATVGDLLPVSFRIPKVLHHGEWSGLEVLVTSPLPTTDTTVAPAMRLAATRELSRLGDPTTTLLGQSDHAARLLTRVPSFRPTPQVERLAASLDTMLARNGGTELNFGGWHGDWGHWNMGMSEGVLQVWDWERFDPSVPFGFDALHFAAQLVRPGSRRAQRQETEFLQAVPLLLAEQGVAEGVHALTLRLYLVEVAMRYLDALEHAATPALQGRTAWILSLLEQELRQPDHRRGRS